MSECMLQLNKKTKEPVPVRCGLDSHLALTPTAVGSQAHLCLHQSQACSLSLCLSVSVSLKNEGRHILKYVYISFQFRISIIRQLFCSQT